MFSILNIEVVNKIPVLLSLINVLIIHCLNLVGFQVLEDNLNYL